METFISAVTQLVSTPLFGVVLTLLIIFQWYKQHAKEQAVKHNLFALRRKVYRGIDEKSSGSESGKEYDMIDDIDAILATLGARKTFRKALDWTLNIIGKRTDLEENDGLVDSRDGKSILTILPPSDLPQKFLHNGKKNGVEKGAR